MGRNFHDYPGTQPQTTTAKDMQHSVYLMSFIYYCVLNPNLRIDIFNFLHCVGQHLFLNSCGVHDDLWPNGKLILGLQLKTKA